MGRDGGWGRDGSRLGCVQLHKEDRPGSKFWYRGSSLAPFILELVRMLVKERSESQ